MARPDQQLDATIEVVTPENIAFHYRVAGPFRRLAAMTLDYILRVGAFVALLMAISMFLTFLAMLSQGMGRFVFTIAAISQALMLVGWFVLDWFYGGFFESYWNGQTPGKRIFGLRVLSINGEPINGLQAVMRNVLRYADLFPLLSLRIFDPIAQEFGAEAMPDVYMIPTLVLGLTVMAMTKRFQRLGDLVCGTMVVIEERQWLTGVAKLEDPRAAQLAQLLPADFVVSPSLSRALAMYVDRRRFFSPGRRREIAKHLAEPLLKRFNLPDDTSYDLLLCALYHRAFVADLGRETDQGQTPFAEQDPFRRMALGPAAPAEMRSANPAGAVPIPTLVAVPTATNVPPGPPPPPSTPVSTA